MKAVLRGACTLFQRTANPGDPTTDPLNGNVPGPSGAGAVEFVVDLLQQLDHLVGFRLQAALARNYLADQEIALARQEAQGALELFSDLAEAHFMVGLCGIFEYDSIDPILAHLRSAAALDPEQPAYVLTLAKVLLIFGQRPEAEEMLEKTLKGDPANPEARELLDKVGRRPEARQ